MSIDQKALATAAVALKELIDRDEEFLADHPGCTSVRNWVEEMKAAHAELRAALYHGELP